MALKVFLCALLAICVTHIAALDLSQFNWIWTDTNRVVPPYASRNFRRDFTSPTGKIALSSEILIAADNNFTLYVNGEFIGQTTTLVESSYMFSYCVELNSGYNVFAVNAENLAYGNDPTGTVPNPAAFISAIQITYTDGFSSIIVTDTNWRANNDTPGFQSIHYNDSSWPYAVILAGSNGWYYQPSPAPGVSSLALSSSYWIWTDEIPPNQPYSNAPVGSRAFRKTIEVPGGSVARSGVIIIDADNAYVLYINGNLIGSGSDYYQNPVRIAQQWKFTLDYPTDDIVIAVNATNFAGPAGLIVAIAFDAADCNCTTTRFAVSDGTWKANHTVPARFEQVDYDDCGWTPVVVEGAYGVAPWGQSTVQNGN
ncbi:hypothetical protein M378DRAFT_171038 [Amanita muscaria Koide BX008]|uniref:Uncharacterized protein n=1 Tax=Amanita muscaria (strain Koide BX008) TaxID=946122 RepID=A0A0C2WPB1_AMAMK|nr:hypothetical protein M378DRAFT_171038 [Amanita muscaria Koide BX008]